MTFPIHKYAVRLWSVWVQELIRDNPRNDELVIKKQAKVYYSINSFGWMMTRNPNYPVSQRLRQKKRAWKQQETAFCGWIYYNKSNWGQMADFMIKICTERICLRLNTY